MKEKTKGLQIIPNEQTPKATELVDIDKMYSREEVESRLWQLANKIDDAYRPYHRQNIIGYSLVKEFIINNLK